MENTWNCSTKQGREKVFHGFYHLVYMLILILINIWAKAVWIAIFRIFCFLLTSLHLTKVLYLTCLYAKREEQKNKGNWGKRKNYSISFFLFILPVVVAMTQIPLGFIFFSLYMTNLGRKWNLHSQYNAYDLLRCEGIRSHKMG